MVRYYQHSPLRTLRNLWTTLYGRDGAFAVASGLVWMSAVWWFQMSDL